MQKSIHLGKDLVIKYIKLKDLTLKSEAQIKYNQYRNILSSLTKESKKILFHKLFPKQTVLKSTWKGIKDVITLKELSNVTPLNIFDKGRV